MLRSVLDLVSTILFKLASLKPKNGEQGTQHTSHIVSMHDNCHQGINYVFISLGKTVLAATTAKIAGLGRMRLRLHNKR